MVDGGVDPEMDMCSRRELEWRMLQFELVGPEYRRVGQARLG